METEQKFKVGDMVVPVKLDRCEFPDMMECIGRSGKITGFDSVFYEVHGWWWLPDSLVLDNSLHTQLIAKVKDLLNLIAGTQAGESEAVKDILYLIYKIQNEKK